jgi:hypothetical protein
LGQLQPYGLLSILRRTSTIDRQLVDHQIDIQVVALSSRFLVGMKNPKIPALPLRK